MEDLEILKQIRENISNNSIINQKQKKEQHNLKKESKKKLIDLIEKHGLSHLKNNILSLAEEAIIIKKTEKEDYKKVANSRLCGYPDLPKEIEWPKIKEIGKNDMQKEDIGLFKLFLFQINLEELPDIGKLPRKGMLYFLIGSNCYWGSGKRDSEIIYFPEKLSNIRNLKDTIDRVFCTSGEPDEKRQLKRGYKIEFEKVLTIPDYGSEMLDSLNLSNEDDHKYSEFYSEYENLFFEEYDNLNTMFGHLHYGAENLRKNISSYKNIGSEKDWEVILSICSDINTELNFCDAGSFSYLLLKEDLEKMNFDNIETNIWSS